MARRRCICLLLVLASGCKTIPEDAYGIDRIRFSGMEELDHEALRACLATQERDRVTIAFGTSPDRQCGVPPFDGKRVSFDLWRKLRKGWPTLDSAVFDRDVAANRALVPGARVLRRRGGQHRVRPAVGSRRRPHHRRLPEARRPARERTTTRAASSRSDRGRRRANPSRVRSIDVRATRRWDRQARDGRERRGARGRRTVRRGGVREEQARDPAALQEASYACGRVAGRVEIDREAREAFVELYVEPGHRASSATVTVTGNGKLPADTILDVADLQDGTNLQLSALARRPARGLRARRARIGERDLDPAARRGGAVHRGRRRQHRSRARPRDPLGHRRRRPERYDRHPDARAGHPHLGRSLVRAVRASKFHHGLPATAHRRSPEDRCRDPFFRFGRGFLFGNELRVEYRRPAFLEPRTTSAIQFRHDWGPDPYELFRRHDLQIRGSLSRPFYDGRLLLVGALNYDTYLTVDQDPRYPTSYQVVFFDESVIVDLRDDSRSPRARDSSFTRQPTVPCEASSAPGSTFVSRPRSGRMRPYPSQSTLAFRFGIGAMFLFSRDRNRLDLIGQALGPQNYRLAFRRSHDAPRLLRWFPRRPGQHRLAQP